MNYAFQVYPFSDNSYAIKRKDVSSSDNTWKIVARVNPQGIITFSYFITDENEKKEISDFATVAAIV